MAIIMVSAAPVDQAALNVLIIDAKAVMTLLIWLWWETHAFVWIQTHILWNGQKFAPAILGSIIMGRSVLHFQV